MAVAQTSQTFTPAAQSDAEKHAMLDRVHRQPEEE